MAEKNASVISQLVTDRTFDDVKIVETLSAKGYAYMTAEEKQVWDTNLKGAYNYSDMNRVESAVKFLSETLLGLPEQVKQYAESKNVAWDELFAVVYDFEACVVSTKTNWSQKDIPSYDELERYVSNVRRLLSVLEVDDYNLPKSMQKLTHEGANNIEKALLNLNNAILELKNDREDAINRTAAAWYFSGEIFAGEV